MKNFSQLSKKNKNIYVEIVVSRKWISLWVTEKNFVKTKLCLVDKGMDNRLARLWISCG